MKRSILVVILATALTPGWAQDPADTGDAPDHGVARLSVVQGSVSVRHGDAGDLTAAAVNAPLVETDRVVTGEGGRAEVQFDWANMIRLAPGSEVRLSQLQYKQFQVQIAAGTTTFRVLRESDAQVEISTPTVSLRPTRQGTYRVSVQPDGMTEITVRDGEAEIFGPQGSESLPRGQTMLARGTPNDPEFQIATTIPNDDWDRWNADRDRQLTQTSSYRYVPPDAYGAENLDTYGQWQNDAQYGNVWVPNEGPDWAPYQQGRWSYIDYYGWTWVSDDPWGWAPYHYGNWYHSRWGWAWYPGAIGSRYYWRPAMVGFFGWGGGSLGVGFGFGNVGWCPLAPFEVYHPWYGRGYVGGRFNVVNNVNVVNVYRNARFSNGVTSMRAGDFGHGGVNYRNRVNASQSDLARAGAIHGAMPFTASAESRRFSDASPNTRGVPQNTSNARFYNRGSNGQGGAGGNLARGSRNGGASQTQNPSTPNRGGGNSPSYTQNRSGNPVGAGSNGSANSGPGNNGGAWRRLDSSNPGGGNNSAYTQNRAGNSGGTGSNSGPSNGGGPSNSGGWRRMEPGGSQAPRANGPQGGGSNPGVGSPAPRGEPSYRQQSPPPSQGYRGSRESGPPPQQPVRVNPPVVQNRAPSGGGGGGNSGGGGGNSHPPSHAGGFGGGHSGGGGGGGNSNGGGGGHGRR